MFRLNKYKRGRIGGYVPFYKVGDKDWINCVEDVLAICSIAEKAPNTLVLGSRKLKENEPLRSKFGNTVTRFVYYISTGLKVHDTQTGLRAFRAELIPVLRDIPGERYEYEMNYYFVLPVIRFGFWSMRLKRSILIIMPSLILIR